MKIAYCLPNRMPMGGKSKGDFTQQWYIIEGLSNRNNVDIIVQYDAWEAGIDHHNGQVTAFERTWSKSLGFRILYGIIWRIQKLFRIPNMNIFSTLARFDALNKNLVSYDLVFERLGKYKASIALTAKILKKPYIIFFDADPIFEADFSGHPFKGLNKWQARNLLSFCLRTADKVICVSSAMQRQLVNNYGIPQNKIFILPNCVDIHTFRPYPEKRESIRQKYHIYENPLVIFVGSFHEWHDVSTLVEAFGLVYQHNSDARLLLVGDGTNKTNIERLASGMGLDKAVTFTGSVPFDEVPFLISAADVTVAPYKKMDVEFWGSPMKLFEYMASGTPLITCSVGQLSEIIKNEENGLLVAPGDACALSAAIEKIINDAALRNTLSHNARLEVESAYSWEKYIDHLEELFAEVLTKNLSKK